MTADQERARRAYEDMVRRLAELDRVDGIELSPRLPRRRRIWSRDVPAGPRDWRPRRPRSLSPRTTGTLVLALVVVGALVWGTGAWRDVANFSSAPPPEAMAAEDGDWPPPPQDAQETRILPEVPVTTTGKHDFQQRFDTGRPVTYDPCRPLHYVVNPTGMPDEGLQLVREAAAQVSAATGLLLTSDGVTDEPLATDRSPLQVDRYGNRWAPVLIGWSTEEEYPLLTGHIAGVAGSHVLAPRGPGSERLVSGQVALDAETVAEMLTHPDGHAQVRALIMHELGHVVGLSHSTDAAELMHESSTGQTAWGPGDLQGLARLGAGDCYTDT